MLGEQFVAWTRIFFELFYGIMRLLQFHIEIGTDMPYCYIANLQSKEDFVNKIETALSNIETKEEILIKRKPFLKKYSIDTTASNYVEFYDRVLETI